MYESPINLIYGEMQMQLEGEILRAVQNVGVSVNEKELLKALKNDRKQYEKGYADAIDEFVHKLKKTFTLEFPSNYESTRPYFTLENVRMIVDEIAEQLKGGAE